MFYRLFYPRQSCMLITHHDGKSNATVVDWVTPVSVKPPMVALALNHKSYSLELIEHSKEFCVCVLPESMKETAASVASASGRVIDKIDEYHLKLKPASKVGTPVVDGALAWVECKVVHMAWAGDHTLVVGEVVDTQFPEDDGARQPVLYNWGSKGYFGLSRTAGLIVGGKDGKDGKDGGPSGKDGKEGGAQKEGKDASWAVPKDGPGQPAKELAGASKDTKELGARDPPKELPAPKPK